MANEKQRIKRVTMRVYVDKYGIEHITPHEYKSDNHNGYSLVYQEDLCLTFPGYDPKVEQAKALENYAAAIGNECAAQQGKIRNQIKAIQALGENNE